MALLVRAGTVPKDRTLVVGEYSFETSPARRVACWKSSHCSLLTKRALQEQLSKELTENLQQPLDGAQIRLLCGSHWLHTLQSGAVATNQEHHRPSVHVLLHHVQLQLCRFPIGCPVLCHELRTRPIFWSVFLLQLALRDKANPTCRYLTSCHSEVSATPRWLNGEDLLVECAGVDQAFCLMPTRVRMISLQGLSLS